MIVVFGLLGGIRGGAGGGVPAVVRGIFGALGLWCGMGHGEGGSISVFQRIFNNAGKIFISVRGPVRGPK